MASLLPSVWKPDNSDTRTDTWTSLSSSCLAHKRIHVLWARMLGKNVVRQREGLWSQRCESVSCLCNLTSCLTADKHLSLGVCNSHLQTEQIIPPRVIGKNKSDGIIYVKASCQVPGTWWIFKHSREKKCLGRKNLPVFFQTYPSEHFYSGMTWLHDSGSAFVTSWPSMSPQKRFLTPRGRDP